MPHIDGSRGISTFVAVLLLLALAVAAGAVIYTYTMGYVGGYGGASGGTFKSLSLDSVKCTPSHITAYVRNTGKGTIVLDRAYIDGRAVEGSGYVFEVNDPGSADDEIEEGETAKVTIKIPGGFQAGKSYEVRLVGKGGVHLTFTVKVEPVNWLSGWGKRVEIRIDHNDILSDLSDFPLLIHLSSSSGINADDITFVFDELGSNANRLKIAVTTADGVTQCYVEIEHWDHANEEAWLWVRVPSISSSRDTILYLYYDSTQSNNTAYVGDTGSTPAQKVWENGFLAVWHLSTTSEAVDSTGNGYDGVLRGATTGQAGVIGLAYSFDGVDDYVAIEGLHFDSAGAISQLTVTAWVKVPPDGGDWSILDYDRSEYFTCAAGVPSTAPWGEGDYVGFHTTNSGGSIHDMWSDRTIRDNIRHHVTWVFDSDEMNDKKIYIDGSLDKEVDAYSTGTKLGSGTTRYGFIGDGSEAGIFDGSRNNKYYEGMADEIRISLTARSAAWIKATYETGRDHLLYFGSEEIS